MKRKMLAAFLAATMVGGLLVGCGNSGDTSGSSKSSSGTTSTASASGEADASVTKTELGEYTEENPYHLVFAFVEFYEQDDAARTAVQDALNEYMIPKYHIEVEFLPLQYAEYQQTIQLMISGGDELDVMPIYYSNASSWIAMNGIVDMNQYMDTPEGQAIKDVLGEANATVGSMNGILFGFPAQKESVELGGLTMRADICDELGIAEEYGLELNQDEYTGKVYDWSVATEIFKKVKEAQKAQKKAEDELDEYIGTSKKDGVYDLLLSALQKYSDRDYTGSADALLDIDSKKLTTKNMKAIYKDLTAKVYPSAGTGLYSKGKNAYWSKDYKTAISYLKKAIKVSDTNRYAYDYLAKAYEGASDQKNAKKTYQTIIEKFPGTSQAINAKSRIDAMGKKSAKSL